MDVGRIFGRGISFPPRVGADGRVAWSEGEANVRESIRVILMTEQRERVALPDFGGSLGRFLFEPNMVETHHAIQSGSSALREWERAGGVGGRRARRGMRAETPASPIDWSTRARRQRCGLRRRLRTCPCPHRAAPRRLPDHQDIWIT